MDLSYIEEESIHIRVPYSSSPHMSLNQKFEDLEQADLDLSRHFDQWNIEEVEAHHHSIPYWKMIPSKGKMQVSRPSTSIVSIPLKKHLLEDSLFFDDEESESFSQNFKFYGQTGKVLFKFFACDSNLESKIIEEFLEDPLKLALICEECKIFVSSELNVLSKIIIDLMIEFWKEKDREKLKSWVWTGKIFYSKVDFPISTNFVLQGILNFETREEYLDFLDKLM
jgi:hypothetical protein